MTLSIQTRRQALEERDGSRRLGACGGTSLRPVFESSWLTLFLAGNEKTIVVCTNVAISQASCAASEVTPAAAVA